MSRICIFTNRRTTSGHSVSHANNKTKRKFKLNLHKKTIRMYDGFSARVKISARGLRHLDKIIKDS